MARSYASILVQNMNRPFERCKEFCPVVYVELLNESDVADISVQKIASFERKLWENTSVFEKSFG